MKCILKARSERRAVAFLDYPGERHVNIVTKFDALSRINKKRFEPRFQRWVNGVFKNEHFHGWPNSQKYKRCFVFKSESNRIYGFTCHPDVDDPRFMFCCLTTHALKNQTLTDKNVLNRVLGFADDADVQNTIVQFVKG